MIDFFFLQVADATNAINCPKEGSEIIYLIGSFMGGSTLAAIVNGYFNVENTKQLLGLESDLKVAKKTEEYLTSELAEKEKAISDITNKARKLVKEVNNLREQQTSGFANKMADLESENAKLREMVKGLQSSGGQR